MLTRMFRNFRNRGLRTQPTLMSVILNNSTFALPLTHTAVPTRGSLTPSFTRATTETGQKYDEAGYLDFTALAGEMVFKGARRVRNALQNASIPSEDFSVAAWAASGVKTVTANYAEAPSGEMTADRVVIDTGGYLRANTNLGSSSNSKTWLGSVYIKATSGTQTFRILLTQNGVVNNYSSDLVATSEWQRFSFAVPFTAGGSGFLCGIADKVAGGGTDLVVWGYQAEDVTGQADQTASEYVSVGVESAPAYHGSMVDGVKCYSTDRSGNPITTTTTYDSVTLNGVAGTYVSTPDSVAASITGDIEFQTRALVADVSPAVAQTLIAKWTAAPNLAYLFRLGTDGKLYLYTTADGSTTRTHTSSITATAAGLVDGTVYFFKATRSASTGVVKFYFAADTSGTPSYTQWGADVAGTVEGIADTNAIVTLGFDNGTALLSGKIYQAQIYNGINGTLAVDFDASRYAGGTTLTGSTGETWTLQGNAAIHPTNYPIVGYVPWEARTNLCLQSNAPTTAPWGTTGTLGETKNLIGPSGAANSAWTMTDNSAAISESFYQNVTLTAAAWTGSVFIQKTTGVQTGYPVIIWYPGATEAQACTVDTSNGVVTDWTAITGFTLASGRSVRINSHNDDWWRIEMTKTGTAVAHTFQVFVAGTTNPTQSTGAVDVAAQAVHGFYGAQVELGSFATPYIPTTTVAVARNADLLTYTGAGLSGLWDSGWLCADITPYAVSISDYIFQLDDGTNTNRLWLSSSDASGTRIAASTAAGSASSPSAYASGVDSKVAVSWKTGSTIQQVKDGAAGATSAYTKPAGVLSSLKIGTNLIVAGLEANSAIRNVYIGTRQLSESELKAVTA